MIKFVKGSMGTRRIIFPSFYELLLLLLVMHSATMCKLNGLELSQIGSDIVGMYF